MKGSWDAFLSSTELLLYKWNRGSDHTHALLERNGPMQLLNVSPTEANRSGLASLEE